MDGSSENLDLTAALIEHYKIHGIVISPYHPQMNGLVKHSHELIVNALAKYSKQNSGDWVDHLPLALWADRVSVRRSTGYTAFELVYRRDCILPIEFSVASWSMVNWDDVRTREDLLIARMQQLDERNLELTQAAENLRESRKANKAYFDEHKHLRNASEQLKVGDLVLLFNSTLKKHLRKDKLVDRWMGPYRIREIPLNSTYYLLEELSGEPLKAKAAGDRVRKFFTREYLQSDQQIIEEYRHRREAAIAERQARSRNPARLLELEEMIEAARNNVRRAKDQQDSGPSENLGR